MRDRLISRGCTCTAHRSQSTTKAKPKPTFLLALKGGIDPNGVGERADRKGMCNSICPRTVDIVSLSGIHSPSASHLFAAAVVVASVGHAGLLPCDGAPG